MSAAISLTPTSMAVKSDHQVDVSKPATRIQRIALFILLGLSVTAASTLVALVITSPFAAAFLSAKIASIAAISGASCGLVISSVLIGIVSKRTYKENGPVWGDLPWNKEWGEQPIPENQYIDGNSAMIIQGGEESTQWKRKLIAGAKSSIELSGSFCGGPEFRQLLVAAREAFSKNPQLRFRLISSSEFLEKEDLREIAKVKKAMGEQFEYLVTDVKFRLYQEKNRFLPRVKITESHIKVLIVDEQFSIVGSHNSQTHLTRSTPRKATSFNDWLLTRFWTGSTVEQDVMVQGDALAKTLRWLFYQLWSKWAFQMGKKPVNYFPISEKGDCEDWKLMHENNTAVRNVRMKALSSGLGQSRNRISDEIASCINAEKVQQVYIANLSFNIQEKVKKVLVEAAFKGKKITVITNGLEGPYSNRFFARAKDCHLLPLMLGDLTANKKIKVGQLAKRVKDVTVCLYFNGNKMWHPKTLLVGDKTGYHTGFIGSWNFTWKSEYCDDELNLQFESEELCYRAHGHLQKEAHHFKKLTIHQVHEHHNHWHARFQAYSNPYMS